MHQCGGDHSRVDLSEADLAMGGDLLADDLIALDEALQKLAEKHETKASLVKLRYFAGLTIEQSAESLGISVATAKRYWVYARAWLIREVG